MTRKVQVAQAGFSARGGSAAPGCEKEDVHSVQRPLTRGCEKNLLPVTQRGLRRGPASATAHPHSVIKAKNSEGTRDGKALPPGRVRGCSQGASCSRQDNATWRMSAEAAVVPAAMSLPAGASPPAHRLHTHALGSAAPSACWKGPAKGSAHRLHGQGAGRPLAAVWPSARALGARSTPWPLFSGRGAARSLLPSPPATRVTAASAILPGEPGHPVRF